MQNCMTFANEIPGRTNNHSKYTSDAFKRYTQQERTYHIDQTTSVLSHAKLLRDFIFLRVQRFSGFFTYFHADLSPCS